MFRLLLPVFMERRRAGCRPVAGRVASAPRPFGQPRAVGGGQLVDEAPDLVEIQLGGSVRVHHRGVVDVLAVFRRQRLHRQLLHVDIGADQGGELGGQLADIGRLDAVFVDEAGHFVGAIGRQ